jgi:hypothetical protein
LPFPVGSTFLISVDSTLPFSVGSKLLITAAGVNTTEWLEDVLLKVHSYNKEKRSLEELLPHLWKMNKSETN